MLSESLQKWKQHFLDQATILTIVGKKSLLWTTVCVIIENSSLKMFHSILMTTKGDITDMTDNFYFIKFDVVQSAVTWSHNCSRKNIEGVWNLFDLYGYVLCLLLIIMKIKIKKIKNAKHETCLVSNAQTKSLQKKTRF